MDARLYLIVLAVIVAGIISIRDDRARFEAVEARVTALEGAAPVTSPTVSTKTISIADW